MNHAFNDPGLIFPMRFPTREELNYKKQKDLLIYYAELLSPVFLLTFDIEVIPPHIIDHNHGKVLDL